MLSGAGNPTSLMEDQRHEIERIIRKHSRKQRKGLKDFSQTEEKRIEEIFSEGGSYRK